MEHFIFNNVNSNTMGIVVKKMPPIIAPKRDITTIKVDGRNGNLHIDNGTYEAYNVSIECVITDLTKINDIKSWLKGIGTIEFSTLPNVVYDCVVKNQIDFEKYLNVLREFPLQLEVNPIGLGTLKTVTKTTGGTFTVGGTIGTSPILEVKGTGNATITLNGTSFTLNDLDTTAYVVDCDLMNVTKGTNANDKFVGSFPTLIIGTNTISWVGTVSEIKIKYKEGWL